MHHIQAGHFRDKRDGREVFIGVVRQFGKDVLVHCQGANMSQDKRVFICSVSDLLHGYIASATWFVFYEYALTNSFAHFAS